MAIRVTRGTRVVGSGLVVVGLAVAGCASGSSTTITKNVTTVVQAAPKPKPRSFSDLVSQVKSGVIRIESSLCGGSGSVGTGVLVRPFANAPVASPTRSRLVLTVDHVVYGSTSITLKRGGRVVGTGTVLGEDPLSDVALVRSSVPIAGHVFAFARRQPRLGEAVAALGYPLGLPITVTRGSVSGRNRTITIASIRRTGLIQTDAALNPGNSGGPLLDAHSGDVLGLVDAGTAQANGIAFAVSGTVADVLAYKWSRQPAGALAPVCSTTTGGSSSASGGGIRTFVGRFFRISYPDTWMVASTDKNLGSYLDTTIIDPASPEVVARVDVTPHTGGTGYQHARMIEASLARQPGYQRLAWYATTIAGYRAWYWEFLVTEGGVSLHKVDVQFVDASGNGFGVLTQAPANQFGLEAKLLAAVRGTIRTR